MRLCDVGESIQEVMESYEVEIDGKTYQGMVAYSDLHLYTNLSRHGSILRLHTYTYKHTHVHILIKA